MFSTNTKSYWERKTKNILIEIYKTECNKLDLEQKEFYTKKKCWNTVLRIH